MPLPSESINHILGLDSEALELYFFEYARFIPDAPANSRYQIRICTKCMRSSDTHDLRLAFERCIRNLRRKLRENKGRSVRTARSRRQGGRK